MDEHQDPADAGVATSDAEEQAESGTRPADRGTIARALGIQIDEIGRQFSAIAPATLAAPRGDDWSRFEHLVHLTTSVNALTRGMRMPKLVLRTMFGEATRPSRTSNEIVRLYKTRLRKGAKATHRFVAKDAPEAPDAAWVEKLVSDWWKAGARLLAQIQKWSETDLDRHRLPHRLLGRLTVREMLFFTLYQNEHHAARVRERG